MFNQRFILINLAVFLFIFIGCGSDSSPTKEERPLKQNIKNTHNNTLKECINLPKIDTGDSYTVRIKDLKSKQTITVETSIVDINATELTYEITLSGDISGMQRSVDSISIHDDFIDTLKVNTTDMFTNSKSTHVYSPYLRNLYNKACVGMVWTNNYNVNMLTTPIKYTSTVEAINESKHIALGTYSTVKIKVENEDGSTDIIWEDVNEAKTVLSEKYDSSGNLVETQELISE